MARNGSGVYSLPPGSTVVNGDTSDATDVNTPIADIAADLNVARPIVAGGTGATSESAARTSLGLAIGTNVQAYDAALTSIAALGTAANKGVYFTAADTAAEFDLTAAGRALLDDADAAAQRTTLGLRTQVGPTASTSGTTVEFNSLPAGIQKIEMFLQAVSLSGTTNNILVQLSTGTTFQTSGYGGQSLQMSDPTSITSVGSSSGHNVGRDSATCVVTMYKIPDSSSHRWIIESRNVQTNGGFITTLTNVALTTELDGVRLTATGGAFDGGDVTIKYSYY